MALGSTGAHEVWVKQVNPHRGPTPLTKIPLAGKRSTVKVATVNMEGLEYLSRLEGGSLDLLFVDVEKNLYPGVLRMSGRRLRGGCLAVFNNAIVPRPLDELFGIVRREFKPLIIPSRAGLLIAYRS
jgi:predicted O-methyltransferase YrrM